MTDGKKGGYSNTINGAQNTDPSSMTGADVENRIFLATVVNNVDESGNGYLEVDVPGLFKSGGTGKTLKKVLYSTPFGGVSNIKNIKSDDTTKFETTQQSYGMWFEPPDIGSSVLVCFAEGNLLYGFVIGNVIPPFFNHMIPGIPVGKSFQGGKFLLPVAEKNKYSEQEGHNDIVRPVHHDMAEAITKQGLINDSIRGAGKSGAREHAPSQVVGILTKGSRGKDGVKPAQAGHQFIMDDEPTQAMIRLRSGKGAQILLDDTTNTIYAITQNGKAWVEMDALGNINMFGEGDFNIRAKKNFNLRADHNVTIEAGHDVKIKAAGDNIAGEQKPTKQSKLGLPTEGTGGSVMLHAAADISALAVRNAQLSAIGGDIDFNAGAMIKTESGLGTAISANLMGVNISAKAGTIGITAPLSVGISSDTDVGIKGGQIRLNTPVGEEIAAKIKAVAFDGLKVTAIPLEGVDQEDQPSAPPEYDREGDAVLTSGGERPGKKQKINTIVGTLITAEPYAGHGQVDPTTEDKTSIEEDASADKETLKGQTSKGDENPADVNTPEGTKLGNGFKDPASGAVGKASDIANAFGNGVNSAGDAIGNAIGGLMDMIPNMENLDGMISKFLPMSLQNLGSMQNMSGMMAAMGIAIPAFRFPTGNALGDKIIGVQKQLKELEYQLGQFSLDQFDLPLDIDGFDVASLKNDVMNAVSSVTDLKNKADGLYNQYGDLMTHADKLKSGHPKYAIDDMTGLPMGSMGINSNNFTRVKEELNAKGIDLTVDGPSLIFQDRKSGIKIVDVSNGIGPLGTSIALKSELEYTKRELAQLVTVPVSENQLLGLTSFATHIGLGNFAKSELLVELNDGNYADVPMYMKRWRVGKVGAESDPQVRQDYIQRREYEIELFTTPDWLKLSHTEMGLDGNKNLSFRQLRSQLVSAKQSKYVEMGFINLIED
ncbi:hypothetical protein N9J02_00440 [bacterium]|jgi:hypothetical protein|nr:hypothetical protein [bacterium]